MSCTIQELQKTEFEILCLFDEICRKHKLKYTLYGGTLLGAVRHKGFIPWDDDIDVIMDYKDYRRFIKIMKKNPIDGFLLCSIETEKEYPLYFAKLRKANTRMPEERYSALNINNGVWIDVFMYLNRSDNKKVAEFQDLLMYWVEQCCDKYNIKNGENCENMTMSQKIIDILPDCIVRMIYKFLLWASSHLGKSDSENVWVYPKQGDFLRNSVSANGSLLKFDNRDLPVPDNYDWQLTAFYGDYMTPLQTVVHVDLEKVEL